jgi:uncharacterized membrane protein YfcA
MLGFGFGLIAMSGLTLAFDLVHAAGLVNLAGLVIGIRLTWGLRRHVLGAVVRRVAPWLLGGVVLGVVALRALDPAWLVRSLAGVVIAVATWNLFGRTLELRPSGWADAVAGSLSGLFGGAFNTGGPPLILYVYSFPASPEVLKGTVQALFLISTLARIPLAASQGLLDGAMVWHAALATPVVVAGQVAGLGLASRLGHAQFRRLAWAGLGLLGAALLLRS